MKRPGRTKEELKARRWMHSLEKSKNFLAKKINNSLGLNLPQSEDELVALLRGCYARGYYDGKYVK